MLQTLWTRLRPAAYAQDLRAAAAIGNRDKLHELVSTAPHLVNEGGVDGLTALHEAASEGYRALVEILLSHGADVNVRDARDATPLPLAVLKRDLPTVELLINNKANPNLANSEGVGPLHAAITGKFGEIVAFLLGAGANVNQPTRHGPTPLCMAIHDGNTAMVQLLLSKDADANAGGNGAGLPPLHRAAAKGHEAILSMLLQHGARPDFRKDRVTALHFAARFGHTRIAQLLLDAGADINKADAAGKTPLDMAESFAQPEVAALLRERGGKVGEALPPPALETPRPKKPHGSRKRKKKSRHINRIAAVEAATPSPAPAEDSHAPGTNGHTKEYVKVRCPKCTTKYRLPADMIGRRARCKECRETFRIPFPPEPKLSDDQRAAPGPPTI